MNWGNLRNIESNAAGVLVQTEVGLSQLLIRAAKRLTVGLGLFTLMFALLLPATPAFAVDGEGTPDSNSFSIGGIIKDGDVVLEGVDISVLGADGFQAVGTTAADGRWSVVVPGKGEYQVTLRVETLPAGASLRDPDRDQKTVKIDVVNTVNVLFPLNDTTTPAVKPGEKPATAEAINAAMKATSNESFGYTEDEIVSSDVVGIHYGSLFDATQTKVMTVGDKQMVKTVSWYDNEMSYVSQLVRTVKHFAGLIG